MITMKQMMGDMNMPEFLYKCKHDFKFWCNVVLQDLYLKEYGGIKDFLDYVQAQPDMETTIDKTTRSGISISYKKK